MSYTHCQPCLCIIWLVDGGWGSWSSGPCSSTCGGGELSYHRFCNNPYPSFGGAICRGDDRRRETCNTNQCPSIRTCSKHVLLPPSMVHAFFLFQYTADGPRGLMTIVVLPIAEEETRPVAGRWSFSRVKDQLHFPAEARWHPVSIWQEKSFTAAALSLSLCMYTILRVSDAPPHLAFYTTYNAQSVSVLWRYCNDPPERYGGRDCEGPDRKIVECNTQPCPGEDRLICSRKRKKTFSPHPHSSRKVEFLDRRRMFRDLWRRKHEPETELHQPCPSSRWEKLRRERFQGIERGGLWD